MVSHKGQTEWKRVVQDLLGVHSDRKSLESRVIARSAVWKSSGLCGAAWWVMKSSRRKTKTVKWTRPWRDVRTVRNILSQRKEAKDGQACSSCGEPAAFLISCCSQMALERLRWWRTVKTPLQVKYKIWKYMFLKPEYPLNTVLWVSVWGGMCQEKQLRQLKFYLGGNKVVNYRDSCCRMPSCTVNQQAFEGNVDGLTPH